MSIRTMPSLVEGLPRAPRVALLLAGGFQIGHAPDAAVLQRLGSSAVEVQAVAETLLAASSEIPSPDPESEDAGPWIVRLRGRLGRYDGVQYIGGEELAWQNHALAWRYLAMDLTAADLDRLQTVILDVLPRTRQQPPWPDAEADPPSPRMQDGLAESLALLGNNDDLVDTKLLNNRPPSGWADATVQRLLSADSGRWSQLSPWLPLLAEAAPRPFLSALILCIQGPTDVPSVPAPVGALRRRLAESHELLHALQILGWDAGLMDQVAQCLAFLLSADPDPHRAVSPRPLSVLTALLGYAMPQTTASAEQRLAILRTMAQDPLLRDSARLLLGALWSAGPFHMLVPAPRPRFLHIHISEDQDTNREAPYGQVETYVELLMQLAGRDARHWADLVSAAHVPDTLACKVLQRLSSFHEQIADPDALVWSELRRIRNWLARAGEPAISRPAFQRRRNLSDEVYALLKPQDPVVRYAHLFAVRPELENDTLNYSDLGERVSKQRAQVLQELWEREDPWEQLSRLGNLIRVPGEPDKEIVPLWLAEALYRSPFANPLLEKLLVADSFSPFFAVAPPFLARHLAISDPAFSETATLLRRLVHEQRTDEAWALAFETSRFPERQGALWPLLDELGEPLVGQYWRQVKGVWLVDRPSTLQDFAIERLLAHANLNEALHIAVNDRAAASTTHRLSVLESIAEEVAAKAGATTRWQTKWGFELNLVVEFLRRLSKVPDVDPERACAAELKLFDALSNISGFEPTFVARKIANSPAWFAERLREPAAIPTVHRLMDSWSGYPGEDLLRAQQAAALERWCQDLLALLPEHRKDAIRIIGSLLARPDPDLPDGLWPCLGARRFLDQLITDPSQRQALMRAIQNERRRHRGMTSRAIGEGGTQERALAQQYRHAAQRVRSRWMYTADLLDSLGDDYEREAKRHDEDAAEDAWRYKMQTPASEESPPQAAPLFPLSRVKLENFRGHANLDLALDPHLNVFIGHNASGKTTLLDAIAAGLAAIQDELFGSKIVDQLINSRTDRTVTWLSAKESRQADSLHLQFLGQSISVSKLVSNDSPDLPTERNAPTQKDAVLWDIRRSSTASRGARYGASEDDPLRTHLRSTKAVLAGRHPTPLPVPIFAHYGTKRAFGTDVLEEEAKHLEDLPEGAWLLTRASAYDGALNPTGGYKLMVSWWRSRQTAEREKWEELNSNLFRLPELEAVRTAVEQAVRVSLGEGMRCTNPRTKAGRPGLIVDFDRGDGSRPEELELAQLSDGFRTHLALVMDLARRMVQANPPPEDDIHRDGWGTRSRAVVLIDEVDLHLHPSWQRYVLAGLRAAFPNAQFIVTTHSPQVIASVDSPHVFKLGKVPTPLHPAHTKGIDSNTILTAVMGDRHRDADAQNELDALADLIDTEQFDKAKVELQRLARKYGETDPEITRLGGLLRFLEPDANNSEE